MRNWARDVGILSQHLQCKDWDCAGRNCSNGDFSFCPGTTNNTVTGLTVKKYSTESENDSKGLHSGCI